MNDDSKPDVWSHNETQKPTRCVVMLGASNLSRAFPIAVSMSRAVFNTPLAFYVAKGHGRSYGQLSSCFGKKISGIFSCGIWRELEQEKSMPITAFMTDVGNDLAYEVPVDTVMSWVEGCLNRLLAANARVVINDLPIDALKRVSARQYRLLRMILFPQCLLELSEMISLAEHLSVRLRKLAKSHQIPFFVVPNNWYGYDPIHPRRRNLPTLWANLLAEVTAAPPDLSQHRCPLAEAWYLRRLRPECWSQFSISRHARQPNGRWRDGTTVSLF